MKRIKYLIFGLIIVLVLAALLWAAKTHEDTIDGLPDVLARDLRPFLEVNQIWDLNLEAIKQRVLDIQTEYPYVDEIIIRKFDQDNESVTIYPIFYRFDHEDIPEEFDRSYLYKLIDSTSGIHLGELYVKINAKRKLLFILAILTGIIALLLVSFFGMYTIETKEEEVRKTVTLLEEKQRELTHLERLAIVGQITANLLHDLKKPVLNIRAEIESLSDDQVRQTIQEETELFLSLVRDLHLEGFLRKEGEKAEFVDIGEVIDRSLRLIRYAQHDINILVDIPEDLPFLFGHRHQLIQVFSNILLNAFQAMEGEGEVRILSSEVEENEIQWLEISISDNGPGMPYEIMNHVFEPFFSTQPESDSTGLGLYITKSIIESMGGTITAHSIPKHGTTFTIRIPISKEENVQ